MFIIVDIPDLEPDMRCIIEIDEKHIFLPNFRTRVEIRQKVTPHKFQSHQALIIQIVNHPIMQLVFAINIMPVFRHRDSLAKHIKMFTIQLPRPGNDGLLSRIQVLLVTGNQDQGIDFGIRTITIQQIDAFISLFVPAVRYLIAKTDFVMSGNKIDNHMRFVGER